MCIAGPDGYFKKVNSGFTKATGYSEQELLSRPYVQFIHPDDVENTKREALELKNAHTTTQFINRYSCKDGSYRWLSWRYSVINDHVFAVGRDITLEKKTELALHDNEKRLNLILGNLPLALLVLDASGNIELTIGKGVEMAGRKTNENHGKNILSLYASRPDICKPIEVALKGQRTYARISFEGLEYEVHYEPIFDEEKKVRQVIAVSMDISNQKRLEDELRSHQLANSMPQIVWAARPDGSVDYYNNRWYEFTGFEQSPEIQERWDHILHPDDVSRRNETWQRSVKTGQAFESQYRFKDRLFGGYRWFLGRALPVKNDRGEIIRWYGTCTDIHEQKTTAEEKQRLLSSERAAKEASLLKSQFLANMSHEIRTPLNGIVGTADLLSTTSLSSEQRDYVETLVQSSDHLRSLVNSILDLAKIEANRLDLEVSDIELSKVLADVYSTLKYTPNKQNIQFSTRIINKDELKFRGDFTRIRQILINLVENAFKFTESGAIELRASFERGPSSQTKIRFEVEDSGVGIAPKVLENIFEPFSQADSSTTRKHGGTGLGLSICKKLTQLMGGKIEASSRLGYGSTFCFEIPVIESSHYSYAKIQEPKFETFKSAQSLQILVAEDQPVNQKVITGFLQILGHKVDLAMNGLEVLQAIQKKQYDLILMDCHMPHMDGFSTTEHIRTIEGDLSRIPILAVTADVFAETQQKCQSAGMNGFVSKPINIKTLFSEIERVTGNTDNKKTTQDAGQSEISAGISDILNFSILEKLKILDTPGTSDFSDEIILSFLKGTPEKLKSLEEEIKTGDFKAICNYAHNLKSVAAVIGAVLVEQTSAQIEKTAYQKKNDELEVQFNNLKQAYDRTKKILTTLTKL